MPKLVQFVWRPRMPSLLTDKDLKRLKYEMKNYTREFEINDRAFYSNQNKEEVDRRRSIVETYQRYGLSIRINSKTIIQMAE